MHFYPWVIVLEKTDSPVAELKSEQHGTQWQPWVFRQGHFIKTGGDSNIPAAQNSTRLPGEGVEGGR